jgi:hypothetical protein
MRLDRAEPMRVEDFEGTHEIGDETVLRERLSSVRRRHFGAFILSHDDLFPCLYVLVNNNRAYLHYLQSEQHAGFQPRTTGNDDESYIHFLQVNGYEADSFDMPSFTVVELKIALDAACEFFHSPSLPAAIDWCEL